MSRWAAAVAVVALIALATLGITRVGGGESELAGQVRFLRSTSGGSAGLVTDSSSSDRRFMASHYWRMRGHSPFFDQALRWAPPSHVYQDLYALYPSQADDRRLVRANPEIVLRDERARPLFIPYDCDGRTCAAWAADPGSELWRQEWLDRARRALDVGYAGVFIDNVNLDMRVGDGAGELVAPVDPRTGTAMRLEDWRRSVAEFAELIDRELPDAEIVHNSIWYVDETDPFVERAAQAADWVEIERGFSDPTLPTGAGLVSFESLLDHVDWLHDRGAAAIVEPYSLDQASRDFELAAYLLVNGERDAIASSFEADPGDWWPGWEADLGKPQGPRYEADGLLRRDFADGTAVVNPPGGTIRALDTPPDMEALDGPVPASLTLAAGEGIVLRRVE